jgi:hypothetical protein
LTLAALPLKMDVKAEDDAPLGDTPLGDMDGGERGGSCVFVRVIVVASWLRCLTCVGLWSALSSSISPKEVRSEKLASEPLLLRTWCGRPTPVTGRPGCRGGTGAGDVDGTGTGGLPRPWTPMGIPITSGSVDEGESRVELNEAGPDDGTLAVSSSSAWITSRKTR